MAEYYETRVLGAELGCVASKGMLGDTSIWHAKGQFHHSGEANRKGDLRVSNMEIALVTHFYCAWGAEQLSGFPPSNEVKG